MSCWISCGAKLLHCNWTEIVYGIVITPLVKKNLSFYVKTSLNLVLQILLENFVQQLFVCHCYHNIRNSVAWSYSLRENYPTGNSALNKSSNIGAWMGFTSYICFLRMNLTLKVENHSIELVYGSLYIFFNHLNRDIFLFKEFVKTNTLLDEERQAPLRGCIFLA